MTHELFADKSLGQHWLRDQASLQAMCKAAAVSKQDMVLEIGPGLGTLTKVLTDKAGQVLAVEFDARLANELKSRVLAANLTVIQQDILKFDLNTLPAGYKVVANIPYYLTSHLLRILSEATNPPVLAALLVQKEVAERVTAQPGDMSLLGVTTQFYWEVSLGKIVPAKLFTPPPKVDSQILVLEHRHQPLFTDIEPKRFFQVTKAGFSQRRKTLLNSLSAGLHLTKEQTKALLEQSRVKPTTRAQELSLEEWHNITRNA